MQVGDRVQGLGKGTIVDIREWNAGTAADYLVVYDSRTFDHLGRPFGHRNAIVHRRGVGLRLLEEKRVAISGYCPECEETDFFFAEDYICAACRDERGY